MMTSTPPSQQQHTDGRTVREIAESNHELVNEVWCRRVFRQILQSLELQYAMQMPHRPIDPDTVLILDSGDPMLLPAPETDAPWSEAGDMHDLGAVVFYAITKETLPAPPLLGSAPDGYSEAFVSAIDRCLSPDPQQRPQNIEQLRELLGIVPLGPAVPVQSFEAFQAASAQPAMAAAAVPEPALLQEPALAPTPAPAAIPASAAAAVLAPVPAQGSAAVPITASATASAAVPTSASTAGPAPISSAARTPAPARARKPRWPLLAAVAAILLLALAALFTLLNGADSSDAVTLALPQAPATAQEEPEAALPALVLASPAPLPQPVAPVPPAPDTESALLPEAPATATAVVRADAQSARQREAAAAGGATYKLLVRPWGMIEVNGTSFGASPPLKRLSLAPGQHTIRIANPNYPEHVVTVNAVKGGSTIIELDFTQEDSE